MEKYKYTKVIKKHQFKEKIKLKEKSKFKEKSKSLMDKKEKILKL